MSVRLLGHLHLAQGQQVIARFGTRKAGALLAYLAYYPDTAHAREILAEILWPGSSPRAARANLRVVLNELRRCLEPTGVSPESVLRTDNSSIELRSEFIDTDVSQFVAALSAADALTQAGAGAEERIPVLTRAVELYCGELLPGYYEYWVSEARETLKNRYRDALSALSGLLKERGDIDRALRYAVAAVSVDAFREESHADLIRLYLAAGDHGSALRQYRKLERTLYREGGRSLSAATRALLPLINSKNLPGSGKSAGHSSIGVGSGPDDADDIDDAETGLFLLTQDADSPEEAAPAAPAALPPTAFSLPVLFTSFLERPELTQAVKALGSGQARLLTMTGSSGTGKTRVAIEAAARLRDVFHQSIWFIPVAEYGSPERIADAVFDALRLQPSENEDPMEQITRVLGRQPSLLVLDGFERLAECGAASVVLELLQRIPTLTLLVTSQIQLRLAGERVITLPPLPVPEAADSPKALRENPCVDLLVDRIRLVRPDFEVTVLNAPEVSELCRRLEGLPLSIELAAPWVQVLSLSEIIQRLADPFALLVSDRAADLSERHRSLLEAVEWSYSLLSPEMQTFFARLSVFESGFTVDAAMTVLQEARHASQYLRQLQERSLVCKTETGRRTGFYLLDTLRIFARSRLGGNSVQEQDDLARRHAEYYLSLAFEAESNMGGPGLEEWLEELERLLPNLHAALDWCQRREPSLHLLMASALWRFWYLGGHFNEGRTHLQKALLLPPNAEDEDEDAQQAASPTQTARAKAVLGLACLAFAQGEADTGRALLRQSLEEFRRLHRRPDGTAVYLNRLADDARFRGDYQLARCLLEESLALWNEAGSVVSSLPATIAGGAPLPPRSWARREIAYTIRRIGDIAYRESDLPSAVRLYRESLAIFEDLREQQGIAVARTALGQTAAAQGDLDGARVQLHQALHSFKVLQDWGGAATAQMLLADIAGQQKRFDDAQALIQESLTAFRTHRHPLGIGRALTVAGLLALGQDDISEARQHLYDALQIAERRRNYRGAALSRCYLALTALASDEVGEATAHVMDALRWYCESGERGGQALALEACAALSAYKGDRERAARLSGAAESLRESLGGILAPLAFQALCDRCLKAAIRSSSGDANSESDAVLDAGRAAGRALPLHEAVGLAFLLAP